MDDKEKLIGTTAYTRDFSSHHQVHHKSTHSDLAVLANGHDAYVAVDYQDDGYNFYVDLETGEKNRLFTNYVDGHGTALHFSGNAFNKPGWVVVSTYDDRHEDRWHHSKVMAVELGGQNRIVNLAHNQTEYFHRCENISNYANEQQASVNRDLTKIIYATNWHTPTVNTRDNGSQFSVGIDDYIIELDQDVIPDWNTRIDFSAKVAHKYVVSQQTPDSVLMLGNSLTGARAEEFQQENPSYHFNQMVSSHGTDVQKHTIGGATFDSHITSGSLDVLADNNQSVVTLQPYKGPRGSAQELAEMQVAGEQLVNAVKDSGETPVLYMVWPRTNQMSQLEITAKNQEDFAELHGIQIAPIAIAVVNAAEYLGTDTIFTDGEHMTKAGAYLIGATLYGFFTGEQYQSDTYDTGVSDETASTLRDIAWQTLNDYGSFYLGLNGATQTKLLNSRFEITTSNTAVCKSAEDDFDFGSNENVAPSGDNYLHEIIVPSDNSNVVVKCQDEYSGEMSESIVVRPIHGLTGNTSSDTDDGSETDQPGHPGVAPVVSLVSSTTSLASDVRNVTIELATNVDAQCKLSTSPGANYGSMGNPLTASADGLTHSIDHRVFKDTTLYARCLNNADNGINTEDLEIPVSYAGAEKAPQMSVISGTGFIREDATQINIEISTDVAASCSWGGSAGYRHAQHRNPLTTTDNLHHFLTRPARKGMKRTYYVSCADNVYQVPTAIEDELELSVDVSAKPPKEPLISLVSNTTDLPLDTRLLTLEIATDVNAQCRIGSHSGIRYSAMGQSSTMASTDGLNHNSDIKIHRDMQYHARCMNVDDTSYVNQQDFVINISYVNNSSAPQLGFIIDGEPQYGETDFTVVHPAGTTDILLEFETDVAANCRYSVGETTSARYSNRYLNLPTDDGIHHRFERSAWNGMTRRYHLSCQNNETKVINDTDIRVNVSVSR